MKRAGPLEAVVDTELFVRGLHTARGDSGRLMTALAEERFRVVTSEPLLGELAHALAKPEVQKLGRRGPLSPEEIEQVVRVAGYRPVQIVTPRGFLELLRRRGA